MIEVQLTKTVVIIGAIIAQGSFAAALLFIQRDNNSSNRYLGLLLLGFSLWLLDDFFNAARIYEQNPNFYFLPIYFSLAFGPLIYFYTRSITESKFKFSKKQLWHFVPVAFQAILYIFLQSKDYGFRRMFWEEIHLPYTYDIEFIGSLISLVIYLILSIITVKEYQIWIKNQYSEISKISLNWLKLILGSLAFICLLWIIDSILRISWQYYPKHDLSTISIGISLLILAGGALLQKGSGKSGFTKSQTPSKTTSNNMQIDQILLDKIILEMQEKKYFLNSNFSLKTFANKLNEPPRKISYHINQGLGKTFIDFVNEYRVNEVKKYIEEDKMSNFTLAGIALECGFNSKSTFNRVFKKISGQSPSSFQKKAQNKL